MKSDFEDKTAKLLERRMEGVAPYLREIFHRDTTKFKKLEVMHLPPDDLRVVAWTVVNKERYRHARRAFKRDVLYHAKHKIDIPYYVVADYVSERLFPEYGWEQIWGLVCSSADFQGFWNWVTKRYGGNG